MIITTLRGDPEGPSDEPQHKLMGKITPEILDLMEIKWEFFPPDKKDLPNAFDHALEEMEKGRIRTAAYLRRLHYRFDIIESFGEMILNSYEEFL